MELVAIAVCNSLSLSLKTEYKELEHIFLANTSPNSRINSFKMYSSTPGKMTGNAILGLFGVEEL
jgi:hypothetical protein